jgi:hypothetical protein
MRKDNILKFVMKNSNYVIHSDLFVIPKYIDHYKNTHLRFNMEIKREIYLNQGSKWSPLFRAILKHFYPNIKFDREIPLVIEDRGLWESLCIKYNVDQDKTKRTFFVVDYIFPYQNLIVEIDSILHDMDYDKARDDYIKTIWGFDILRLYEFGKAEFSTINCIENFERCISNGSINNNIDYTGLLVKRFCKDYSNLIPILTWFEKYIENNNIKENFYISVNQLGKDNRLYVLDHDYLFSINEILIAIYGISASVKP